MWLIQCPVITCNGKESEMEHTHTHHTHTTHTHTTHTHTHTHTQEASLVAQMVKNLPVMQESQV